MGVAYYIVLDNVDPGLNPLVNGKAVAREANRIDRMASTIGIPGINEFVSACLEDLTGMSEDFGVEMPIELPSERWFDPTDGLQWIAKLQEYAQVNPEAFEDAGALLSDLTEYIAVLEKAKSVNARWHFAVDF